MADHEPASLLHIVPLVLGACTTAYGIVAWSGVALALAGLSLLLSGAIAFRTGRAAVPARWRAGVEARDEGPRHDEAGRAASRVMGVVLAVAGTATLALGASITIAR